MTGDIDVANLPWFGLIVYPPNTCILSSWSIPSAVVEVLQVRACLLSTAPSSAEEWKKEHVSFEDSGSAALLSIHLQSLLVFNRGGTSVRNYRSDGRLYLVS